MVGQGLMGGQFFVDLLYLGRVFVPVKLCVLEMAYTRAFSGR